MELTPGRPPPDHPPGTPAFVDITEQAGVAYESAITDYGVLFTAVEGDMVKMFGGFSVADLNGDGNLDILLTERSVGLRLFVGDGNLGFSVVDPDSIGLTSPLKMAQAFGDALVKLGGDWSPTERRAPDWASVWGLPEGPAYEHVLFGLERTGKARKLKEGGPR